MAVYNDKGVMTGFEDRVDSTTTSDGSLRYAVGTDSVTNDVKLGGIHTLTPATSRFTSERGWRSGGQCITAIAQDSNDRSSKVNDDNRLTDVYIKVVDETGLSSGRWRALLRLQQRTVLVIWLLPSL